MLDMHIDKCLSYDMDADIVYRLWKGLAYYEKI